MIPEMLRQGSRGMHSDLSRSTRREMDRYITYIGTHDTQPQRVCQHPLPWFLEQKSSTAQPTSSNCSLIRNQPTFNLELANSLPDVMQAVW